MSGLDLSPIQIATAKVIVKGIWSAYGETPLIVQFATSAEQEEQAWGIEARRYLELRARLRHHGLRFNTKHYVSGQYRPQEWDEHFVGEKPGIDDPVLSKELPRHDVFYPTGPVKFVANKLK